MKTCYLAQVRCQFLPNYLGFVYITSLRLYELFPLKWTTFPCVCGSSLESQLLHEVKNKNKKIPVYFHSYPSLGPSFHEYLTVGPCTQDNLRSLICNDMDSWATPFEINPFIDSDHINKTIMEWNGVGGRALNGHFWNLPFHWHLSH